MHIHIIDSTVTAVARNVYGTICYISVPSVQCMCEHTLPEKQRYCSAHGYVLICYLPLELD